jgi:ketosteroid isomerase-like protein
MATMTTSDLDLLRTLNQAYLDNVLHGDVEGFRRILADDFLASLPDGALLTKEQFLARTGGPRTLSRLTADDVRIRVLGQIAIIHAETHFTTLGGQEGRGRYTDIWEKRAAGWLAVAAHVTRL